MATAEVGGCYSTWSTIIIGGALLLVGFFARELSVLLYACLTERAAPEQPHSRPGLPVLAASASAPLADAVTPSALARRNARAGH